MSKKLDWVRREGTPGVMADISYHKDHDYVISHRTNQHVVSYRPPGQHHHVGQYETEEAAKIAAQEHHNKKGQHSEFQYSEAQARCADVGRLTVPVAMREDDSASQAEQFSESITKGTYVGKGTTQGFSKHVENHGGAMHLTGFAVPTRHLKRFKEAIKGYKEGEHYIIHNEQHSEEETEQFAEGIAGVVRHHGFVKAHGLNAFKHKKLPGTLNLRGSRWEHNDGAKSLGRGTGAEQLHSYLQGLR